MRIDRQIESLKTDPAPLAGAGQAVRDWLAEPDVAPVMADLERFASGAGLDQCPALAGLFKAEGGAFGRSAALAAVRHMRESQVSLWPWRHFSNGVLHSVTLANCGRAS